MSPFLVGKKLFRLKKKKNALLPVKKGKENNGFCFKVILTKVTGIILYKSFR
jgi:hypothetical protein